MDLAQIVKELWRLRRAVVFVAAFAALLTISVVFKVTTSGVESRSLQFGAASTELLVDSRSSALGRLSDNFDNLENLSARAMVFGNVMTSDPVLREIAADAGIPREAIVAEGPTPPNVPRAAKEPTAESRGNDLLGEFKIHRMRFDVTLGLPVINVHVQAPDGESAVRLADAAATGFRTYLERLQADTPDSDLVEVRQLGRASGGTVNQGANVMAGVLAFLAVFTIGCLLLLMASNVARNWDRAGTHEQSAGPLEPLQVTGHEEHAPLPAGEHRGEQPRSPREFAA